ncbi:MAG: Na+/H+ antiporter NhaA [Mariprofundaceae bacterium]|nr:Na+/H+ antiporter NhaA [Mariprofundaceae bacterium]
MRYLEAFLKNDSASGILLICAAILALILSNSAMSGIYESFLHLPVEIHVGALHLDKSLYHWVNDGLMAIFFLLIGLEVKREVLEGDLSSIKKASLPVIAAIGGILVPAMIYLYFNQNNTLASSGWAIPTATDIAFALGILSLLGKRVPVSLKIFLMALAIIDDLGAIVIIALLYTSNLSMLSLVTAASAIVVLISLNLFGVSKKAAYFIVGVILWVSVLKSGVHATLAGVILAFTIPLNAKDKNKQSISPVKDIEHGLHFWVAFFILPLFAFVNAGINITNISLTQMAGSVPIGIMLGLFVGKQLGVFGFSWLAIKLKLAELPKGCSWSQLYGVSVLTGIGFTMSLFITSLAFTDDTIFQYTDKLAILIGSCSSGFVGYFILKRSSKNKPVTQDSSN